MQIFAKTKQRFIFDFNHHKTNFFLKTHALGHGLKKQCTITLVYESCFRRVLHTRSYDFRDNTKSSPRGRERSVLVGRGDVEWGKKTRKSTVVGEIK